MTTNLDLLEIPPKDIMFIHVSYRCRNNQLAKRYCVNHGSTDKASGETAYIKS